MGFIIPSLLKFSALPAVFLIAPILCSVSLAAQSPSSLSSYESLAYSRRSLKKAHYGSPCNSSVKCDIHSLLTCEERTCQCLYQDAMTYSAELGTCISLVNEICGYLETKQVFINCVPNSLCDQHQGTCKCTQGHVELERQCVKQKGFGESCHSDSECLTDLSLICFEEICQCDPEQYVPLYASEEDLLPHHHLSLKSPVKCVAFAGHPCGAKTGCVPKASCVSGRDNGDRKYSSPTYGWMHPRICQCDPGYEADSRGFCRGKYASECDVLANVTCSDGFHCLDGICRCKYPDDQAYQGNNGQCISLVGGPCPVSLSGLEGDDDDDGNQTEILSTSAPASCGKFMECEGGSCVCKHGFVDNKERGCDLSFGQPCAGQTMSKCDKAAGLHCVNGRCACKDELRIFDIVVGKYVGKIGSSCSLPLTVSLGPSYDDNDDCHRLKLTGGAAAMARTNLKDLDTDCEKNAVCQVSRSQLRGISPNGICIRSNAQTLNEDGLDEGDLEGL